MPATFYKARAPRVVCPCGQVLGDARAEKGWRRCDACVVHFAKSRPTREAPAHQEGLFERVKPKRATPAAAPGPTAPETENASQGAAAPPKVTAAVAQTDKAIERMRRAALIVANEPRTKRLNQLLAAGVCREDAFATIDAEFGDDDHERD